MHAKFLFGDLLCVLHGLVMDDFIYIHFTIYLSIKVDCMRVSLTGVHTGFAESFAKLLKKCQINLASDAIIL